MNVSRETPVSRETQERLQAYASLLLRWNTRINLISRSDEAQIWQRHIADALQLVGLIPPGVDRGIDLGSGAGFPGLIMCIATGMRFDLIEADQRKAAFLREAARAADAPAKVHACRIETVPVQPARLITARALAPLPKLLALAEPLLAVGGQCLFPKSEKVDREVTEAMATWTMRIETHISRTDRSGVILRISEVERVRVP